MSLAFGSRVVSIAEIGEELRAFVSGDTAQEIGAIAVAERIPRTALSVIAGAALALSGSAHAGDHP